HCLRPTTAGAGYGGAAGVDLGQIEQEIESSDRVPRLQSHNRLQMGLRLRTEEAPVGGRVKFGPLFGEPMRQFKRFLGVFAKLNVIGVPDHVVMKADAAHSSALDR